MKIFERVIRKSVNIDDIQFGFRPGRGTIEATFIVRQLQEKFLNKKKDLYFAFIGLEKGYNRVPGKSSDGP